MTKAQKSVEKVLMPDLETGFMREVFLRNYTIDQFNHIPGLKHVLEEIFDRYKHPRKGETAPFAGLNSLIKEKAYAEALMAAADIVGKTENVYIPTVEWPAEETKIKVAAKVKAEAKARASAEAKARASAGAKARASAGAKANSSTSQGADVASLMKKIETLVQEVSSLKEQLQGQKKETSREEMKIPNKVSPHRVQIEEVKLDPDALKNDEALRKRYEAVFGQEAVKAVLSKFEKNKDNAKEEREQPEAQISEQKPGVTPQDTLNADPDSAAGVSAVDADAVSASNGVQSASDIGETARRLMDEQKQSGTQVSQQEPSAGEQRLDLNMSDYSFADPDIETAESLAATASPDVKSEQVDEKPAERANQNVWERFRRWLGIGKKKQTTDAKQSMISTLEALPQAQPEADAATAEETMSVFVNGKIVTNDTRFRVKVNVGNSEDNMRADVFVTAGSLCGGDLKKLGSTLQAIANGQAYLEGPQAENLEGVSKLCEGLQLVSKTQKDENGQPLKTPLEASDKEPKRGEGRVLYGADFGLRGVQQTANIPPKQEVRGTDAIRLDVLNHTKER